MRAGRSHSPRICSIWIGTTWAFLSDQTSDLVTAWSLRAVWKLKHPRAKAPSGRDSERPAAKDRLGQSRQGPHQQIHVLGVFRLDLGRSSKADPVNMLGSKDPHPERPFQGCSRGAPTCCDHHHTVGDPHNSWTWQPRDKYLLSESLIP